MKIKTPSFFFFLIFSVFSTPAFLKAQDNHCVVKKNSFGNKASAVKTSEVKSARSKLN